MTVDREVLEYVREHADIAGVLPSEVDALDVDAIEAALVAIGHAHLDELNTLARAYPMAVIPLWTRSEEVIDALPEWALEGMPETSTDQWAQAVEQLQRPFSVVSGGNRAGKTFAALLLDVAVALGRDHPMVSLWLQLTGIPPELIPIGPGRVIVVAPSSGHSRKTHRIDIDALLPAFGVHWYDKNGKGEAFVEIECPGYATRARIDFMSVDQGDGKFKGTSARRYHIDEEPLGHDGERLVKECRRGASAEGGHVVITATPQDGETWMTRLMHQPERCYYSQLDALGNYLVNDYDGLLAHFADMDPQERRMRRYGDVIPREGLIYTRWQGGTGDRWGPGHLCDPFDIPDDWPRFRGADFGLSNPTCVLWGALGDDDTLYVYRCIYEDHQSGEPGDAVRVRAPRTYEEIGEDVHRAEGATVDGRGIWKGHGELIERSWGDPAAAEALKTWRRMDLTFSRATNDVQAGISKVHTRMRVMGDGRPRLKVFTSCAPLIGEVGRYRRDPKRKDGAPIKKGDHAMDALRYLVMGVDRWLGD